MYTLDLNGSTLINSIDDDVVFINLSVPCEHKLWHHHPRFPSCSWLSVCPSMPCALLFFAPVNLDMVLKQLEPQQMHKHFLGVKSGRRKKKSTGENKTDGGVTDPEAARDAFTAVFKTNTCCRGWSAWGTSEILQSVTPRLWLDHETELTELQHYKLSLKSSSLNYAIISCASARKHRVRAAEAVVEGKRT